MLFIIFKEVVLCCVASSQRLCYVVLQAVRDCVMLSSYACTHRLYNTVCKHSHLVLYCFLLRCVALRCVALRCVALRCVALRCVALRCVALRCVALRCVALRCVALRCVALRCVALRCVALRCVALRCVALRCVALRCVALRCVALRCVALRAVIVCIALCYQATASPLPPDRQLDIFRFLTTQLQRSFCKTRGRSTHEALLVILHALLFEGKEG